MISALLEGRKTMTRRLLYSLRKAKDGVVPASASMLSGADASGRQFIYETPRCGFGEYYTLTGWHKVKPGDRLWVRETHHRFGQWDFQPDRKRRWTFIPHIDVPAQFDNDNGPTPRIPGSMQWWRRPAIFMPRECSRLTLIVTAIKIERLQAISRDDAMAEGCGLYVPGHGFVTQAELAEGYSNFLSPRLGFETIWRMLHGDVSWSTNPYVVAISFRVVKANIDSEEAKAA